MAAAGVSAGFELPPYLEAGEPPEARGLRRDDVRLLVSDVDADTIEHGRFFDLPRQHPFHCCGSRGFENAFLLQEVFKRGASIGIFRHGFHTPFCAYLLALSLGVASAESF